MEGVGVGRSPRWANPVRGEGQPMASVRAIDGYVKFLFGHTENMTLKWLSARDCCVLLRSL